MTDYVNPRSKLDMIKRRIAVKTGMANTPNLSTIDRVLVAAREIEEEDAKYQGLTRGARAAEAFDDGE